MPLSKEGLKKNAVPKDIFQFRDGDNIIRVLPPTMAYFTEDIDFIAYRFYVHYGLGPEGSPPVVCPRTLDKKGEAKHPCPVCETSRRLRRNPATKDMAGEIGSRTRYIMNIIDMEHPERGIQVAEVGPSIYDKIFEVAIDPEYGDVLDLMVGRNFKVTLTPASRSKTGFNSYSVLPGANISEAKKLLPKGWKEKIAALHERVGVPPPVEDLLGLVNSATGGQGVTPAAAIPPSGVQTASTGESFVDPSAGDSVVKEGSDGSPANDVSAQTAAQTSAPETPAADAVVSDGGDDVAVEGKPDGAPDCWGKDFQPSAERCKACEHKEACMEKYLEG